MRLNKVIKPTLEYSEKLEKLENHFGGSKPLVAIFDQLSCGQPSWMAVITKNHKKYRAIAEFFVVFGNANQLTYHKTCSS